MIRQHLGHLKAKQASLNMKMIRMLHVTISFQLGMISSLYLSQGHGFSSQSIVKVTLSSKGKGLLQMPLNTFECV